MCPICGTRYGGHNASHYLINIRVVVEAIDQTDIHVAEFAVIHVRFDFRVIEAWPTPKGRGDVQMRSCWVRDRYRFTVAYGDLTTLDPVDPCACSPGFNDLFGGTAVGQKRLDVEVHILARVVSEVNRCSCCRSRLKNTHDLLRIRGGNRLEEVASRGSGSYIHHQGAIPQSLYCRYGM